MRVLFLMVGAVVLVAQSGWAQPSDEAVSVDYGVTGSSLTLTAEQTPKPAQPPVPVPTPGQSPLPEIPLPPLVPPKEVPKVGDEPPPLPAPPAEDVKDPREWVPQQPTKLVCEGINTFTYQWIAPPLSRDVIELQNLETNQLTIAKLLNNLSSIVLERCCSVNDSYGKVVDGLACPAGCVAGTTMCAMTLGLGAAPGKADPAKCEAQPGKETASRRNPFNIESTCADDIGFGTLADFAKKVVEALSALRAKVTCNEKSCFKHLEIQLYAVGVRDCTGADGKPNGKLKLVANGAADILCSPVPTDAKGAPTDLYQGWAQCHLIKACGVPGPQPRVVSE